MKRSTRFPFAILVTLPSFAHAGPRASQSGGYTLTTDTNDAAGARSSYAGSTYTNDGSMGGITGISTVSNPTEMLKAGYIAQLSEPTSFAITALDPNVDETTTRQLTGLQVLDDDTILAVPATSVAWSVQGGPLTGIDLNGLATAGIVYQNTAATAQGMFGDFTATLGLIVVDTIPDNFGTYAGDGLDDAWQFQYFGLDHPDAAPGLDPDGDGQKNAFEFIAGLVPTDPLSRFHLRIAPVPDQPTHQELIFDPVLPDRTYTVEYDTLLSPGLWTPLTGFLQSEFGDQRTITDTTATEPRKFYHVKVEKPF